MLFRSLTLIGILDGGAASEEVPAQEEPVQVAEEEAPVAPVTHAKPHNLPDFSGLEIDEDEE